MRRPRWVDYINKSTICDLAPNVLVALGNARLFSSGRTRRPWCQTATCGICRQQTCHNWGYHDRIGTSHGSVQSADCRAQSPRVCGCAGPGAWKTCSSLCVDIPIPMGLRVRSRKLTSPRGSAWRTRRSATVMNSAIGEIAHSSNCSGLSFASFAALERPDRSTFSRSWTPTRWMRPHGCCQF